jgi:hypothetical protein
MRPLPGSSEDPSDQRCTAAHRTGSTTGGKTHLNTAYLVEVVKFAFLTATGYMAWQIFTARRKHDWTKAMPYVGLFAVVFIAIIVANLVFTLLFQRYLLFQPVSKDPVPLHS